MVWWVGVAGRSGGPGTDRVHDEVRVDEGVLEAQHVKALVVPRQDSNCSPGNCQA